MRFYLFVSKKIRIHNCFSSTPSQSLAFYYFSSKFHSNRWLRIAPNWHEDPFGITSNQDIFFGPKPLFQTIHMRKGSRQCSSNQRLKELLRISLPSIQHQSKFNGLIVSTSEMEHLGLSYKLFVRLRLHICTYDISIVVLTYFCFLLSEQHQRLGFGYDNEADQSDDSVCTLAFPAFSEDLPINNCTQQRMRIH